MRLVDADKLIGWFETKYPLYDWTLDTIRKIRELTVEEQPLPDLGVPKEIYDFLNNDVQAETSVRCLRVLIAENVINALHKEFVDSHLVELAEVVTGKRGYKLKPEQLYVIPVPHTTNSWYMKGDYREMKTYDHHRNESLVDYKKLADAYKFTADEVAKLLPSQVDNKLPWEGGE